MTSKLLRPLFLTCSALLLALPPASAGNKIHEPFQGSGSALPQGWLVAPFSAKKPYTPKIIDNGTFQYLQFLRIEATDQAAIYYIKDEFSPGPDNQFSNFTGSVIFQFKENTILNGGVIIRASNPVYQDIPTTPLNAYYISVRGDGTASGIFIYQDPKGYLLRDLGSPVAQSNKTPVKLKENIDYKLVFTAQGADLSAKLYSQDSIGDFTEELASVQFSEAHISSGFIGLRSNIGKPNAGILFRDFQITPSHP